MNPEQWFKKMHEAEEDPRSVPAEPPTQEPERPTKRRAPRPKTGPELDYLRKWERAREEQEERRRSLRKSDDGTV